MSHSQNDHIFHSNDVATRTADLIVGLAEILRREYGSTGSAVKYLARDALAEPRSARNWYEGRNLISLSNLSFLLDNNRRLQIAVMSLLFRKKEPALDAEDWWDRRSSDCEADLINEAFRYVPINVPDGSPAMRQVWFLKYLPYSSNANAVDITQRWGVSLKTARRDITELKQAGRLARTGSNKVGAYIVVPAGRHTGI
jgi:hypothetical protein